MGLTNFPHGITSFGIPVFGGSQDISGKTWFVDGNLGSDGYEGTEREKPFKSLAKALAVSHADIGNSAQRHWARRNTIHIFGDSLTEDLTALAQKTDIIGWGTCDGLGPARIYGNHVIANTSYPGCRFFNVAFADADALGTIFTATSYQAGLEFHGCDFLAASGGTTAIGLLATAVTALKVKGCRFLGSWGSATGFSTAAISLGAGAGLNTIIDNNFIENPHATGQGIIVNASRSGGGSYISRNYLQTVGGIPIDDDSDTFMVIDNRWITNIDCATYTAGFDFNLKLASGNLQTGGNAGDHDAVPHILNT